MFRAFFDESGLNPKKDRALVMGGFLSSVEEWERASDAWDECLNERPKIQYFSHHEASSLDGEFATFSTSRAAEKTNRLARVIAAFDLQGFCATVSYSWFANRDKKVSRKIVGTRAYDWGFLAATKSVLYHMRDVNARYKVDFVFDRRPELPSCIAIYNELKSGVFTNPGLSELMSRAGECIPGDDKELVALQMADLLSGEFSNLLKTNKPTETWRIIANRPVAHMSCRMPPRIPDTLALQKIGKEVLDDSGSILKRIYKDKEHSMELLIDVEDLIYRRAFFDLQFQHLKALYETDEHYKIFVEDQRKRNQGKRSKK